MKTITKEYQVYPFDELNEDAQHRAINAEIQFQLETYNPTYAIDEISRAVNEAERMMTPWFAGSYVWDYAKEYILACCRDNSYLADGSIFVEGD